MWGEGFNWDFSNYTHAIPEDDFKHVKGMHCPCRPQIESLPGLGATAICHRRIDLTVPDTIPEDWA